MTNEKKIVVSWDEADIKSSKFVAFEKDTPKVVTIQNWELVEKIDKFSDDESKETFFECEVTAEDGFDVEKVIDMSSNPFRRAVKPILFELDPTEPVSIKVMKTGEGPKTKYEAIKVEG